MDLEDANSEILNENVEIDDNASNKSVISEGVNIKYFNKYC